MWYDDRRKALKAKNQHMYNKSQATLEVLAEEFKSIGRYVTLEEGHLIVLALPPKKKVEKKKDANDKTKRRESYGRP